MVSLWNGILLHPHGNPVNSRVGAGPMPNDTPPLISQSDLVSAGIEDPESATRFLESLAGQGVTDDNLVPLAPILLRALARSPDADRALQSFARWFTSLPTPSSYLSRILHAPETLDRFCQVTGCSQYFADLIVRNPEYFAVIEEPGTHVGSRSADFYYHRVSSLVSRCKQTEMKRDALRRWKAREMLLIGVRDLSGLADMPTTAREFSDLADSCVRVAYDIAVDALRLAPSERAPGFAVLAMGKLGGLELNYSSDIDLMFVHADDAIDSVCLAEGRQMETSKYLARLAETVIGVLADETSNGNVFRVDMRLRPEGRFGTITRSLSGFEAYYESWAESWEFQALLKVRYIAGSRTVGHDFMKLIEKYVYREYPSAKFLDEMKQNKRRIEEKCELEGETETNVKTGFGGIRDVEFLVQSLQLRHGFRNRQLRPTNTLLAIHRLHRAHLLADSDFHRLADGYIFLRNLEHRLQLLNNFQVQNLPKISDHADRAKIALRMGYSNLDEFETDLERHRSQIHQSLDRLFYANADDPGFSMYPAAGAWKDLGALLDNLTAPAARERLTATLTEQGFYDIPAALGALQLPMTGNEFGEMPPDTPEEFKRIAPDLMTRASRSASPDSALAGVEAIALAVPNRAQLYAAFNESPDVLDRLIRLSAGSPPLLKRLSTHLEWLEAVLSPDARHDIDNQFEDFQDNQRLQYDRILAEMRARRVRARNIAEGIDAISSVFQREALLIGANEIWEYTDSSGAMSGLTSLADSTLQALIELCTQEMIAETGCDPDTARVLSSVAIIGLGKLGGAELGYASDWDILVVHRPPSARSSNLTEAECQRIAEDLVTRVTDAAQKLITRGAHIELDLRLRPWGRTGSLAPSVRSYIGYYKTSAETWERQAALKARFVAGNTRVGSRLMRVLHAVSFGHKLSPAEDSEVIAMKNRIEKERLNPAERFTDVKLGFGGLIDIEWIAQRLQLQHGYTELSIRKSNTIQALSALAACGLLESTEADVLIACYNLLVRVRNALWLQIGRSQDTLPTDQAMLRIIARQLGYGAQNRDTEEQRLVNDVTSHMREARAIFERRYDR